MTTSETATSQGLGITVSDKEGETIVSLSGRVTVDSSPGLREQLHALLKRPSLPMLAIELSELTYLDFSGIATLIEALRIARRQNTRLQLRGLRDGPRHLLEVAGLLSLFDADDGKNEHSPSEVS